MMAAHGCRGGESRALEHRAVSCQAVNSRAGGPNQRAARVFLAPDIHGATE